LIFSRRYRRGLTPIRAYRGAHGQEKGESVYLRGKRGYPERVREKRKGTKPRMKREVGIGSQKRRKRSSKRNAKWKTCDAEKKSGVTSKTC